MKYYTLLAAMLIAIALAVLSIVYAWATAPVEGAIVTILWLMLVVLIISEDANR